MNPEAQGLWARVLVRALVVVTAGVMALGFLGPEAALLVAFLTVLTHVLLWARSRYARSLFPEPGRDAGGEGTEEPPGGPEPPQGPQDPTAPGRRHPPRHSG
ncbi:hypothetical protein GCM10007079_02820 [Nocardiopsis terrae]|uniref:Uncharacterized protein n=1 Tax=Nocardiopsis terrae TaxID=372655 RepID=A0ABR9HMW5_9ACTN|nr:hypothetical protein [Nocardiopsis terrae]MBE1460334.1 hypothetical protein [Nocardiopsis terrae]GHC70875.1 hypothetical protein GCM10007079_02820 [Nocardiopsis terrae]